MANTDKILQCSQQYDAYIPEIPAHQYLMDRMKLRGERVALVNTATKEQWKYSDLLTAINQFSASLQATYGNLKGQFVALALPNCAEFFISLLAVLRCGAVASFVNPLYTPRELEHVTSIIQPSFWICCSEFSPMLPALGKLGFSTKSIMLNSSDKATSQWHSMLNAGRPEQFVQPSFNVFQDLATMPFSGGTTGMPKGVMLSHHNIVTALCQFKVWCPYDENDVNLSLLPMFHQYGCLIVLTSLAVGARVVILSKFVFTDMLQTIQDHKVTMIPLVPPIALLLSKHPIVDRYDLSSVKVIISSAAPLSHDIIDKLSKKYGWEILIGYGLTECTLATHFTPRRQQRHPSVGVIMPFYEGKVVNTDTGAALGPKEVGEICVRGYMVMKGYRGNPAATAEMIDADGWLHTGDIGYYDQDGWFYIVDRMKELIKYKGFQVAPSELEHLLLEHPDVSDAAVIGVPDESAGELPRAYVVKRPGAQITEKDIIDFVNGQVSPYKQLRGGVVFIEAIPKLASGKTLRRVLKAQAVAVASKL